MEFVIIAYLNFRVNGIRNYEGEIMGWTVCFTALIIVFIALPVSLVWFIYQKPSKTKLQNSTFKRRWGSIYENLKSNDRWQLSYYLIFVLRRSFYLILGLYVTRDELTGIQW